MNDMSYSKSGAQGSKCYEQLNVVYDMNDPISPELKALDAMKSLVLWMIWRILSHELKPLDALNRLEMWMTWITPSRKLKALDAMTNWAIWIIWTTQDPVSLGL